ncbi:MAG: hypothetical protein ABL957_00665 [Parvularculaceae bacterium]
MRHSRKRGLWVAAGVAALQPFLLAASPMGAAAQTLTRARLFALPLCPATQKAPEAAVTESVGAAALGILVPKLLSGVNNIVSGLVRSAAQRARKNAHTEVTASAEFNFYQYDIADPKLVANPGAGCLVFVQGEFGDASRSARFESGPLTALRSVNRTPSVYEYRTREGSPRPTYVRKNADGAGGPGGLIDTYPEYFQSLGLVNAPNLYIEFALQPAASSLGADYELRSHFQLQPLLVWYRNSIGSKGGDKKPTLGVEVSFRRAQSAQPFASDPEVVDRKTPKFSIVLPNLAIGSVFGPDALKDMATARLPIFPLPTEQAADLSDAEGRYFARRNASATLKAGAKLGADELTILRANRKYFYLKAGDFMKDPLLYIGEYVSLPATDTCAELGSNAPTLDAECSAWSVETAKAQALELAILTQRTREVCLKDADTKSKQAACDNAMALTQVSWEVARRKAMEILNKFEARQSARQNDGAGRDEGVDAFGATIAEMTVVETREIGALYDAILKEAESFTLLSSEEQTTVANAIQARGKDERTKLGESYALQQKLLLAQNAQADLAAAETALLTAETNLRLARAGLNPDSTTRAESSMSAAEAALRKARADLLAAKGNANIAAFTAGEPLPYPDIGGPGQ